VTLVETILAELFPVVVDKVPPLRAFEVTSAGTAPSIAGGKLAYRLRKPLGGHWVWTGNRVVTDSNAGDSEVTGVLNDLWRSQAKIFGDIRAVRFDSTWKPTRRSVAEFVAFGLVGDFETELRNHLPERIDLTSVWAERVYEIHGWEVSNRPAVSVSVSSRLVHKQDLRSYAKLFSKPDDLVGLEVYDRTSSMKGEVDEVVGLLKDHRIRLLGLSTRPEMLDTISNAPDDEPVLHVTTGRSGYDYPLSALGIIVRVSDFKRFGVNGRFALSVLKIAPAERWSMVWQLAQVLIDRGLLGGPLRSDGPDAVAFSRSERSSAAQLTFGRGETRPANSNLLRNLEQCGLYRVSPRFAKTAIRVGVLDSVKSHQVGQFLGDVRTQVKRLGLDCTFEEVQVPRDLSRSALEKAVEHYETLGLDILLALLPYVPLEPAVDDFEDWGPYQVLKAATVGRGIPSQVVMERTMSKPFAVGNVVLGILGKTGNIPFTLSERLPGVDLVVGLDIARERKTRLPGSMNATAIARIYMSDGEFVRYVIHDAPLEGETIPEGVLKSLFPPRDFRGKRVVVHRDGYFRGGERDALRRWGSEIEAAFHLIEVIKSGSPRIYGMNGRIACLPEKGMLLKISEKEALLVSTPPPFKDATPNPLHIRTDGSLTLEAAVESILSLTLLHYGSVRQPRLPVTIHYSDKIAYLALRGIKPKDSEGSVPFWL
jgi:hypothetical protein